MTEYVAWVPEYNGHQPPFWVDGMACKVYGNKPWWFEYVKYQIPAEAVNPPFDVEAWLAQGRANADKLPDGLVLPEALDWADYLEDEWVRRSQCLANFLREHCRPIGDVK